MTLWESGSGSGRATKLNCCTWHRTIRSPASPTKSAEQALTSAVADAARGNVSTLMYLDSDQFKIVNDTLGHGSGDRLLVTLTDLIRSVLRAEDMLCSVGRR